MNWDIVKPPHLQYVGINTSDQVSSEGSLEIDTRTPEGFTLGSHMILYLKKVKCQF